jgi:zeaxanthin glucosyltransferase
MCPPVLGHLNPMTALARELLSRNHDVLFIGMPNTEPIIRAAGVPFFPCDENENLVGSVNDRLRQLARLEGEECLRLIFQMIAVRLEQMLDSLPATLAAAGVEGLILDSYDFFRGLIPMSLGMPYVHVSNALHFDYSGHTPLCLYDWPPEDGPAALTRNRKGLASLNRMLTEANAAAREYARRNGLPIDWEDPSATISKLAHITQTPKEFDFESSHWPPQFQHTGPFHDDTGRIETEFPWDRLTGEPLIYASMGTILNGLPKIFRAITAAVAMHKDAQLVLSIGNIVDPKQIGFLPPNAIVVRRAPQLELLKRASVCITHAGLNTTLEALSQGVPQVAIPVSFDQPGVAARIAHKKSGIVISSKELTAIRLSVLIDEVLKNPVYRDNARRLQKIIAKKNGLSMAADLLERSFGLSRKVRENSALEISTVISS